MIVPARAIVRPQVFIADADTPLPVEDEVRERVDAGVVGLIQLLGPPGSGKSTALSHLAYFFDGDPHVLLADCPAALASEELVRAARDRLVIFAAADRSAVPAAAKRWRMVTWTEDLYIEYLLAAHRERCGSVMSRILADPGRRAIGGRPELWRAVLDCLAADESLTDAKSALRSAVTARLHTSSVRATARRHCFLAVCKPDRADDAAADRLISAEAILLLRHSFVQMMLAAEHLAISLESVPVGPLLEQRLPASLVQEAATLVTGKADVTTHLQAILDGANRVAHPMAASLLHATALKWVPRAGAAPLLAGAYLARAAWRGVRLKDLDVSRASMIECDLADSCIDGLIANGADLSGAMLHGARLDKLRAEKAILTEADLSHARAPKAHFRSADLRQANLEGALLKDANFSAADLREARVCRADLSGANLTTAQLEGADFSGANLSSADLTGLTLRGVDFTGAQFSRAVLRKCDLEGVTLPGARMEFAILHGTYLTGSRMPEARLRGAILAGAGLADIEWERADLRGADLRGSTFHLGSSRSGLVGSPLACEGSRTGFYTDESHEQYFKSPEEIRKANLRGADLRGARILDVDFYLVDVRDAKYTSDQAVHLRQTGAILETRV
jgi:uncharacterized protein YjbI with pentapeptide repeats